MSDTITLTARFPGRDEAELAAARMRRAGLRFGLRGVSVPGEDASGAMNVSPLAEYWNYAPAPFGLGDAVSPLRGFGGRTAPAMTDALLTMRVATRDADAARAMIRENGGRVIER